MTKGPSILSAVNARVCTGRKISILAPPCEQPLIQFLYAVLTDVWKRQPAVAVTTEAITICPASRSGPTLSATADACATERRSGRSATRGAARRKSAALCATGSRTATPWASRPARPRETHTSAPSTDASLISRATASTSLPACAGTQRDWRALRWEWRRKKGTFRKCRFGNIAGQTLATYLRTTRAQWCPR